jgi:dynein intermediate chain 4, axonemal
MFSNYSVTNADWNPVNKDLLAVTYQLESRLDSKSNDKEGLLMFWTLKNPAFP